MFFLLLAFWVVNLSKKLLLLAIFSNFHSTAKSVAARLIALQIARALCCFAYCGKIVKAAFMIPFAL